MKLLKLLKGIFFGSIYKFREKGASTQHIVEGYNYAIEVWATCDNCEEVFRYIDGDEERGSFDGGEAIYCYDCFEVFKNEEKFRD